MCNRLQKKSDMRQEKLVISRYNYQNVLEYSNYIKLCQILLRYTELNSEIFQNKVKKSLLTSKKSRSWRSNYMPEFDFSIWNLKVRVYYYHFNEILFNKNIFERDNILNFIV